MSKCVCVCVCVCVVGGAECRQGTSASWSSRLPPETAEHERDIQMVYSCSPRSIVTIHLHYMSAVVVVMWYCVYSLKQRKSCRESERKTEPVEAHLTPVRFLFLSVSLTLSLSLSLSHKYTHCADAAGVPEAADTGAK